MVYILVLWIFLSLFFCDSRSSSTVNIYFFFYYLLYVNRWNTHVNRVVVLLRSTATFLVTPVIPHVVSLTVGRLAWNHTFYFALRVTSDLSYSTQQGVLLTFSLTTIQYFKRTISPSAEYIFNFTHECIRLSKRSHVVDQAAIFVHILPICPSCSVLLHSGKPPREAPLLPVLRILMFRLLMPTKSLQWSVLFCNRHTLQCLSFCFWSALCIRF